VKRLCAIDWRDKNVESAVLARASICAHLCHGHGAALAADYSSNLTTEVLLFAERSHRTILCMAPLWRDSSALRLPFANW